MAFSYSFHMSAKSHAVNTSGKVAQVSRHNLREYESAAYDRSQIEIIAGSDKSILDTVKDIYHAEFDAALERYNAGKRSDRKIDDYLEHVSKSRSDVAAEIIIQVGDSDFWKDKSDLERRQMSYIYRDQLRALEKLVPEFKVASAVIHYDESSPHMHVVGVPVADGYKKGLERQVAKTKVFTADRLSFLQDRMRENAIRGMELEQNQNLFANMQLKEKEKGRNKDIPKQSLNQYYALTEQIDKLSKSVKEAHVEQLRSTRAVLDSKKELQHIQEQTKAAARDIIRYNDANNKLIEQNSDLSADHDALLQKNASMKQIITQNEQKLEQIDAVSSYLSREDRNPVKIRNYTISGKKSILGQSTEDREGIFVEGLTKEELHAVIDRAKVEDSLTDHADQIRKEAEQNARNIELQAEQQAQMMINQAQQQIQEAQRIIRERDSIIKKAREWASKVKEQFKELTQKLQDMLTHKDELQRDIESLEAQREQLEPLAEAVHNLKKAKQIASGELDHEFTKASFKPWDEMPYGKSWKSYQQEGKLLALYNDGSVVKVGLNDRGGWDDQIRRDEDNGFCTVGIMLDEKRISVPEKLLKELMRSRDRSKPISHNLQAFIQQQNDLEQIHSRYRDDLER